MGEGGLSTSLPVVPNFVPSSSQNTKEAIEGVAQSYFEDQASLMLVEILDFVLLSRVTGRAGSIDWGCCQNAFAVIFYFHLRSLGFEAVYS